MFVRMETIAQVIMMERVVTLSLRMERSEKKQSRMMNRYLQMIVDCHVLQIRNDIQNITQQMIVDCHVLRIRNDRGSTNELKNLT
jgi:ribose 5-phosphate isomerase